MKSVLFLSLCVALSFISSSFADCPLADFTGDCFVDFNDFAVFACTANDEFLENLNSFLDQKEDENKTESIAHKELSDIFVLSQFFGIGNLKPRARKFLLQWSKIEPARLEEESGFSMGTGINSSSILLKCPERNGSIQFQFIIRFLLIALMDIWLWQIVSLSKSQG